MEEIPNVLNAKLPIRQSFGNVTLVRTYLHSKLPILSVTPAALI